MSSVSGKRRQRAKFEDEITSETLRGGIWQGGVGKMRFFHFALLYLRYSAR